MSVMIKVVGLWIILMSSVWAREPPQNEWPGGGLYAVKDGNIVSIAGRTMVKNSATIFYNCGGELTSKVATGSLVEYKLVEPSTGPIPLLAVVKARCD